MILCWIILIIGVVTAIIGGIVAYIQRHEYYGITGPMLILIGLIFVVIGGVVLICCTIEANQELHAFISQKEYIEDYEPTSEYDAAAILNKKIELNDWLYEAQYVRENRPICSFYGDEILELTPIK
jgi:energy-coupling factor transporter transmembrane protein EcfT